MSGLVWDGPGHRASSSRPASTCRATSGKLEAARAAAADDRRSAANVDALGRVLPRQLEPGEITARLGAPWIPPADVEAFCTEVLDATVDVERLAALGQWTVVYGPAGERRSASPRSGARPGPTPHPARRVPQPALHTVYDQTDDGRRVRNAAETIAAREKQEALGDPLRDLGVGGPDAGRAGWPSATTTCSTASSSPPTTAATSPFPGLAATFTPPPPPARRGRAHPHRGRGAARPRRRRRQDRDDGHGRHGAAPPRPGQQARRGRPNHMLEQFCRECLQLYPQAKVLVADRDRLSKERRKEFVARCATGDWDAVVITRPASNAFPLGGDRRPATSARSWPAAGRRSNESAAARA